MVSAKQIVLGSVVGAVVVFTSVAAQALEFTSSIDCYKGDRTTKVRTNVTGSNYSYGETKADFVEEKYNYATTGCEGGSCGSSQGTWTKTEGSSVAGYNNTEDFTTKVTIDETGDVFSSSFKSEINP